MSKKTYLGDAVFVEEERGGLVLTTSNGIATTDRIVLEPKVLDALLRYVLDRAAPLPPAPKKRKTS